MSAQKHKTDYVILGVLALIAAVMLMVFLFWGWIRQDYARMPGLRTTRSTNVDGVIIYYTLLERLGTSVERSRKMLLHDVLAEVDVLFLLDPLISIQSAEIKDLHEWLSRGGVLITTRLIRELHPDLGKCSKDKECSPDKSSASGKRKKSSKGLSISRLVTPIPDDAQRFPLARDVSEVLFEWNSVIDESRYDPKEYGKTINRLLSDSEGLRIVGQSLDRGYIILLSDSSFLANGYIGSADNSVLAVNLVSFAKARSRGDRVVFDEYHLSAISPVSGFRALGWIIFTTPAGWAVLSLTLAGMLFLIYKGRQFGARRGLEKERRRSKIEYVYAVGSTYRAARANRLTLKLIYLWLKRKAINVAGLAGNASNRAIAVEMARRSGGNSDKYREILDECDALLGRIKITERQLVSIINRLSQIETEVFHEHRDVKQGGR